MNGKVTTEVYTGTARTKEQSQRRVSNLVTRMVSKEQPTDLEGRTRAQLIKARRTDLHKDRIHLRRLFFFLTFSLATTRRTIHSRTVGRSMTALCFCVAKNYCD